MLTEPVINKTALLHILQRDYGLTIACKSDEDTGVAVSAGLSQPALTFVPHGEVSHSFIAQDIQGQRYYLKLLTNSRLARLSARRLNIYLPLTCLLHTQGWFTRLAYPLRNRADALWSMFDEQPLIVFDYLDGRTLEGHWPPSDALWRTLARTVAQLHATTSQVSAAMPILTQHREQFSVPFEATLCQGLEALSKVTPAARPGQRALCDLLLPHKATILSYLARLHALGDQARALSPDLVLCHTDITQGNILVRSTDKGESGDEVPDLYILDWEGAMLAPPEHDLFIFTGENFPAFLVDYVGHCPTRPQLHPEIFGFYFYRRNLEDLTDWIVRILYENTDAAQDAHDLEGIQEDCIAGWPYLEPGIQAVARQLDEFMTHKAH